MVNRTRFAPRVRLFILSCDHTVILPHPFPKLGDKQWCQRCVDYTALVRLGVMYHTRCGASCRSGSRSYTDGKDKTIARARKHVAQHPIHVVEVFEDETRFVEIRNTEDSLFSNHSDIREIAQWNQDILRGRNRNPDAIVTTPSFVNGPDISTYDESDPGNERLSFGF